MVHVKNYGTVSKLVKLSVCAENGRLFFQPRCVCVFVMF